MGDVDMGEGAGRTEEELFELALKHDAKEFAELIAPEEADKVCSVVWALNVYYKGEHEAKLKEIVAELGTCGKLPADALKAQAPFDLQGAAALAKRYVTYSRKRARLYETYSIKEEEAEGFCKLWAYLLHDMNKNGAEATVQFIQSCIGTYSLFPHRCADLVLTVWEYFCSLDAQTKSCAPEVLRALGIELQELVGFRYLHHDVDKTVCPPWVRKTSIQTLLKDVPGVDISFYSRTPASLHKLTGSLINEGLLHYSELVPYLQPDLGVLQKEAEDYIAKKLACVQQLGSLEKKDLDKDFAQCKKPNCYGFNGHYGVLLGTVFAGAYKVAAGLLDDFAALQPMTYEPLEAGVAHVLQKKVDVLYARVTEIADNKRISEGIEETVTSAVDSLEELCPLLCHLGHRIVKYPKLFGHLLSILAFCAKHGFSGKARNARDGDEDEDDFVNAEDTEATSEDTAVQRLQKLLVNLCTSCFLPGLATMTGVLRTDKEEAGMPALTDASSPLHSHEVWSLLEYLPFRHRFQIYENVTKLLASNDVDLQWATAKLGEQTARTLRRLTNDNTGELARKLAMQSNTSPLTLFTVIFRHVMNYGSSIIPPVIEAMKNFSPMSLDVMTYKLISLMADDSRDRLKPDKTNLDDWVSNLGQFIGLFFRKHTAKYDVVPMLEFMLWRSKLGKTTELTVLSSMMRAAGVDSSEDLSDMQLQSLEGGPVARLDCVYMYDRHYEDTKTALKAQTRLTNGLRANMKDSGVASQMLLALAVMSSRCLYEHSAELDYSSGKHLRMIKEEHIRVSHALVQLLTFISVCIIPAALKSATDKAKDKAAAASTEAIQKIIPYNVSELVKTHGVFVPVAQMICQLRVTSRPLLEKTDTEQIKGVYGVSEVADIAMELLPEHFRGCLGLYLAFWSLRLTDINEGEKITAHLLAELERKEKDEARKSESQRESYFLTLYHSLRTKLEEEKKQQATSCATTQRLLRQNSKEVLGEFAGFDKLDAEAKESLLSGFFQTCLWPRVIVSSEQALFCARFLKNLAQIGFPIYAMYQFCCRAISRVLCSCTLIEVTRVSVFIRQILIDWPAAVEAKLCTKEDVGTGHAQLARGLIRILHRMEIIDEPQAAFEMLRSLSLHFPQHDAVCQAIGEAMEPLTKVCFLPDCAFFFKK